MAMGAMAADGTRALGGLCELRRTARRFSINSYFDSTPRFLTMSRPCPEGRIRRICSPSRKPQGKAGFQKRLAFITDCDIFKPTEGQKGY